MIGSKNRLKMEISIKIDFNKFLEIVQTQY